eukprot:CAMPEP_0196709420 /NCGR_PEP_ID=MMETSP1090-20130531/68085_1 /TAXON_ID=37098 /ORGANISM="Isochrysis sp, Strain CCMP1244" /LENGTH=137 /DNA_ID=CAMNT_0042049433 /DNA_START=144 /DNA_END=555 /DNA_ORIENTATION=-
MLHQRKEQPRHEHELGHEHAPPRSHRVQQAAEQPLPLPVARRKGELERRRPAKDEERDGAALAAAGQQRQRAQPVVVRRVHVSEPQQPVLWLWPAAAAGPPGATEPTRAKGGGALAAPLATPSLAAPLQPLATPLAT